MGKIRIFLRIRMLPDFGNMSHMICDISYVKQYFAVIVINSTNPLLRTTGRNRIGL